VGTGAAVGAVRDQKDREVENTVELLEDTRETSHGVRGRSRSSMPAECYGRGLRDGVIEPKSVLQILVVFRHKNLRLLGLSFSEVLLCLLIGLRIYSQGHDHDMVLFVLRSIFRSTST
jgi:hypothetical protein